MRCPRASSTASQRIATTKACVGGSAVAMDRRGRLCGSFVAGQPQLEARALAGSRVGEEQAPAMRSGDRARDRQAETRALRDAVGARGVEAREDALALVHRDARAIVD